MFAVGTICEYSSDYATERVRILECPAPRRFSFLFKADPDRFYLVEPLNGGAPFRAHEDELALDPWADDEGDRARSPR